MNLSFGQKYDDDGLIMPWLTHDCLDEIKRMELSGKNILAFGGGLGDAWLSRRCKKLMVIERDEDWLIKAAFYGASNGVNSIEYLHRPCKEGSGRAGYYTEIPNGFSPNVIINDDIYRTEVVEMAINYFKSIGGGVLISDNYWQDFVWKSPKAIEMLKVFKKKIFPQKNHTNHNGNKWKTAIHYIE